MFEFKCGLLKIYAVLELNCKRCNSNYFPIENMECDVFATGRPEYCPS
jgi:hypothetical protein